MVLRMRIAAWQLAKRGGKVFSETAHIRYEIHRWYTVDCDGQDFACS